MRDNAALELYAAGVRYRKALDTLVTEAAAGQVRPDQIDCVPGPGGIHARRGRRLAHRTPRRARGRTRRTAAGHEPAAPSSTTCSSGGFVAGGSATAEDRDALWERFAAWTGLPRPSGATHAPPVGRAARRGRGVRGGELGALRGVRGRPEAPAGRRTAPAPLRDPAAPGHRRLPRACAAHLRERHADFYRRTADETEASARR